MAVGFGVGVAVGSRVGVAVGSGVGAAVGFGVGVAVGSGVGVAVGFGVGVVVGSRVGMAVCFGYVVSIAIYEDSSCGCFSITGNSSIVNPKPTKLTIHTKADPPANIKVFFGDFFLTILMRASTIHTDMNIRLITNKNASAVFIYFPLFISFSKSINSIAYPTAFLSFPPSVVLEAVNPPVFCAVFKTLFLYSSSSSSVVCCGASIEDVVVAATAL